MELAVQVASLALGTAVSAASGAVAGRAGECLALVGVALVTFSIGWGLRCAAAGGKRGKGGGPWR